MRGTPLLHLLGEALEFNKKPVEGNQGRRCGSLESPGNCDLIFGAASPVNSFSQILPPALVPLMSVSLSLTGQDSKGQLRTDQGPSHKSVY